MKRLLFLLLLFPFGCRKEPPPPVPDEPTPEIPALPSLPIAFASQLDEENFPPTEANAGEVKWDFAEGKRYDYVLQQDMLNYSTTSDRFGKSELRSRIRGEGILEMLAGATRVARAYYKLTIREYEVNKELVPSEQLNKQPPAKIEFVVSEDGTIREAKQHSGGETQVLEFLLPMPGERNVDWRGSYRQKGTIRTKIAGFAKVDRWVCARIESEFELDLEPLLEDGSGLGKMKGRTVGYFAVETGHFAAVRSAVSMVYHSRQKFAKPGEPVKWNVATLESHTLLQARLRQP